MLKISEGCAMEPLFILDPNYRTRKLDLPVSIANWSLASVDEHKDVSHLKALLMKWPIV
jgi:hypothetical protein